MKALGNIVAYLSIVLNVYYLSAWLYVFNRFETHELRQDAFDHFILEIPNGLVTVLLILLSIASLIILSRKGKFIPVALAVLQSFFIFLWIWQYL